MSVVLPRGWHVLPSDSALALENADGSGALTFDTYDQPDFIDDRSAARFLASAAQQPGVKLLGHERIKLGGLPALRVKARFRGSLQVSYYVGNHKRSWLITVSPPERGADAFLAGVNLLLGTLRFEK